MNVRFNPRATERRAKRLAFGTPNSLPGLVSSWSGIDLSNDYEGQLELSRQAVKLLGVDVATHVMHSSASSLFTSELTYNQIEFFCYRIAANVDTLVVGSPLTPWRGLLGPLLAPLQIINTKTGWSRSSKSKLGTILNFRIIDGPACHIEFSRWFPQRFLWVLGRDLGILKQRSKNAFVGNRAQLYGMRFIATLINSRFEPNTLTFERYSVGQFSGYNAAIMKLRSQPCPLKYTWPCYKCSIGEKDCPVKNRACRQRTLLLLFCSSCNKQTYHDGSECVLCRKRPPSIHF